MKKKRLKKKNKKKKRRIIIRRRKWWSEVLLSWWLPNKQLNPNIYRSSKCIKPDFQRTGFSLRAPFWVFHRFTPLTFGEVSSQKTRSTFHGHSPLQHVYQYIIYIHQSCEKAWCPILLSIFLLMSNFERIHDAKRKWYWILYQYTFVF